MRQRRWFCPICRSFTHLSFDPRGLHIHQVLYFFRTTLRHLDLIQNWGEEEVLKYERFANQYAPKRYANKRRKETTVNNRDFTSDGAFQAACSAAEVKPTKRQASKFRMGQGAAYKASKNMAVADRLIHNTATE